MKLTKQIHWEKCWNKINLPAEIKKTKRNSFRNEILKIFERFLPKDNNLSILEIGGAPGQYLAYFAKKFHYKIYSLDYSVIGCEKTKENFDRLNLKAVVYQKDLFSDNFSNLPLFDIVYSLGFIEHFSDLELVIEKHLQLLKPGGILLIGAPNFLGINHWLLKKLNPELLSTHNLSCMNIRKWETFEKCFNLEVIFKGYIGGFEPRLFIPKNNRVMFYFLAGIGRIADYIIRPLGVLNSKYWNGYAIGIYKKTK